MPSQGSIASPVARPARPERVPGVNRFKAPNYRPERPEGNFPQYQTDFQVQRQQSNIDSTSPLSIEVVLPPINPNNPNFQTSLPDPNGFALPGGTYNYNPYFPPNYSGSFPNQYPYPPLQPASSSSSTSTSTSTGGGNGGSAAAASAAGSNVHSVGLFLDLFLPIISFRVLWNSVRIAIVFKIFSNLKKSLPLRDFGHSIKF